jgi:hypothetical protein
MGQTEFLSAPATANVDPRVDYCDDKELPIHRTKGIPESSRFGWESAWIDLGGEG